jgi:hypothetical protein
MSSQDGIPVPPNLCRTSPNRVDPSDVDDIIVGILSGGFCPTDKGSPQMPLGQENQKPGTTPPTRVEMIQTMLTTADAELSRSENGRLDAQMAHGIRAAAGGIQALALLQMDTNDLLRQLLRLTASIAAENQP